MNFLQRMIDLLYRIPKSNLKKYRHFGGYINYRKMIVAKRSMEKSSLGLPPVHSAPGGFPIYFLTGKNYIYQTLYCIHSLNVHNAAQFRYILVDDGSFDENITARLKRQLPGGVIISQPEINENIERVIPTESFPALRSKRLVYPHIRKLTDIHTLPGEPWKLVFDSDMLFWDTPVEIIKWLQDPVQPIHLIDCGEAYGYSKALMEKLSGSVIKPLLNVGVIGLHSGRINWKNIEVWITALEEQESTSYFLEQALTAMIVGDTGSIALDSLRYMVNPQKQALLNDHERGILHHYVDQSKEMYYQQAWKQIQS